MKRVTAFFLLAVMVLSLGGCATRSPVPPEELKAAAQELELTVTEATAEELTDTGVTSHVTCSNDDVLCQLLVFSDESAAKSAYAQFLSMVTQSGAQSEKKVDTTTYNKYFASSDQVYCALVRINNSVFYGEDTGENGTLKALVEKIGYK